MSTHTYTRIAAADVLPGQYVARARTHHFAQVTATERLSVIAVRLYLGDAPRGYEARADALLWLREPRESGPCDAVKADGNFCQETATRAGYCERHAC